MSEHVKQHYVPRFYLKNFTNNGLFNALNLNSLEIKKNINYSTQCFERYFYGTDLKIEKEFSIKETKWSNAIQNLINGETIDEKDKESIKEFALYQFVRTQSFNHEMGIRERLIFDQYYKNMGIKDDALRASLYYRYLCGKKEEDPYNEKANISIVNKYSLFNELAEKGILVKKYSTKTKLITSDAPIILYNPINNSDIGLKERDLIIIVPLCQNIAVFIYNKDVYFKYKDADYINTSINEEALKINSFEYIIAKDYVYGTSESLETDYNSSKNERKLYYQEPQGYRNEVGTTVLMRYIIDNYEFDL